MSDELLLSYEYYILVIQEIIPSNMPIPYYYLIESNRNKMIMKTVQGDSMTCTYIPTIGSKETHLFFTSLPSASIKRYSLLKFS